MIVENLSTQFTTTLASNGGSITNVATTFNVANTLPSGFKPPFRVMIGPLGSMTGEIVLVTAVSTLAWTVTRGQETTLGAPAATSHNDGEAVSPVLTSQGLSQVGVSHFVDATDYGADASGVTDSTTGINAALTAAGNIGTVFLRSGVYRVSGNIPLGYGQSIVGAGHYNTWVYTTSTTADVFTLNTGSSIKGMYLYGATTTATSGATLSGTPQTIATGTLATGWPASGTGSISLTNGSWTTIAWTGVSGGNSLTGCTGVGAFSAAAVIAVRSAGAGINDNGVSVTLIEDMWVENMFTGVAMSGVAGLFKDSWIYNCIKYGMLVTGVNSAPFVSNVTMGWGVGSKPAAQMEVQACGNLTVVNSQLIQGVLGMEIAPTGAGVFSVYCMNVFFDSCTTAGMSVASGANIVRSKWDQCWFCTSVNGVVINNTSAGGLDFQNCEFSNNSANGMLVSAASDISIQGSRIAGNTTAGINVTASPSTMDIDIVDNMIGSVSPGFGVNGTGIILGSGTYGGVRIQDNDLTGNTAPFTDSSTTVTSGKVIVGNAGLTTAGRPMVATPSTITTTEAVVVSGQLVLPIGSLLVGTTIKVTAHGTLSGTSPTIVGRLRLGTLGTTSDTQVCANTAAQLTSGIGWCFEAYATIRSLGSSGTALGNCRLTSDNILTGMRASAQTATVTVNTTVANTLSLTFIGAGTSPVITVVNCFIEVIQQ